MKWTVNGFWALLSAVALVVPGTLVEAGGQRQLFDAGRGVPIRLTQAGAKRGTVSAVVLTHLHSDHVVGLPDLMLTGWLPPFGRRSEPCAYLTLQGRSR